MKDVMTGKVWLVAWMLLFLPLTACSSANNDNPRTNIAIDSVIIYERQGGLAGINQTWVIHLDGTIDGPGNQKLSVPPEKVWELMESGTNPEIASLAAIPSTPDACCDQFTYTFTMISGETQWSLSTTDSGKEPQEVAQLFNLVQALIAEAE